MTAQASDNLVFQTSTPLDGSNDPARELDPAIEIFGPDGTLLASDSNGGADGRNASAAISAPVSGQYRVRVLAENGSSGTYFLTVAGASAVAAAPAVVTTTPTNAGLVATFPATVTVQFSESLDHQTVAASDLTIDGVNATSVTAIDGQTFRFDIDPSTNVGDRTYSVSIAAGAVQNLQGVGSLSYSGTFRVDTTAPRILSTTWNGAPLANSRVLPPGPFTFTATVSEPLFTASQPGQGLTAPSAQDVIVTDQVTGQTYFSEFDVLRSHHERFSSGYSDAIAAG